jgi:hypothetical protein
MEKPTSHSPRRTPHRFSKVERAAHLASWKQRAQSAQVYADEHGLLAGSLYAWSARAHSRASKVSPFVPVRLGAPNSSAREAPTITVRSGKLECAITGAPSPGELVGLVQLLKREVLDV